MDSTGIPAIIATDQEGWEVQRLYKGFTLLPDPLAYGAVADPQPVFDIGRATGAELKAVGVTMNLAPVADLTTRQDFLDTMRVMNRRTWGDDPVRVGELTAAYIDGLRASGVIGVLKHFPGHGGGDDSHAGLPLMDVDLTEARRHMQAFKVAIENGAPAVMVGHLYYPALETETDLPSSLSPTMMSLLRNDLNFDGVIMSDALDMGALTTRYTPAEVILNYFKAGGDMIVIGPYMERADQQAGKQRIIEAVQSGEIPEARVDESLRRILQMKMDYGLIPWQPVEIATVTANIARAATSQALVNVYLAAATLIKDDADLLPLKPDANIAVMYPVLIPDDPSTTCRQVAPNIEYVGYTLEPPGWAYGKAAALGREKDAVVIITENTMYYPGQQRLVDAVPPEKAIVVALGNPYQLETMPNVSTFLTVYSSNFASYEAVCRVLFDEHAITGKLPMTVAGYESGFGLTRR
jgi:beta-N-acetylhexosaminidase